MPRGSHSLKVREMGRARKGGSLSARGVLDLEEPSGEGGGRAEGPGRETRSRETAQRAVNTMWEGANGELRTPPRFPPSRDAILEGENIYAVQGARQGESAGFHEGQPDHLLPPLSCQPVSTGPGTRPRLQALPSPSEKSSCSLEHKRKKQQLGD